MVTLANDMEVGRTQEGSSLHMLIDVRGSFATAVSLLVLSIICSSLAGCYIKRLAYRSDPEEARIGKYRLSFRFDQFDWTAPPVTDDGDTAFILYIHYSCMDSTCENTLEVSPPVLLRNIGEQSGHLALLDSCPGHEYSTLLYGTIKPDVNRPDTVTLGISLRTRDPSGAGVDSLGLVLRGVPEQMKKGVLRAMIEGI